MPISWTSLVSALESAPGSFFYALLLLLLLSGSSLWLHNRTRQAGVDRRVSAGLTTLMGLRLIEALIFGLYWFASVPLPAAAAPLERSIHLIGIIVFAWLWHGRNSKPREQQLLFSVELLIAATLSVLLILPWVGSTASYNYTNLDYIWSAVSFLFLGVGFWQIFRRNANAPRAGLAQFGILFLGQVIHLFLAEPFGNMPLATQAADLLAAALLFFLPARQAEPEAAVASDEGRAATAEEKKAIPAFFDFDSAAHKGKTDASLFLVEELAREIAIEMEADACAFAAHSEEQDVLDLQYGYNGLQKTGLELAALALKDLPRLDQAIKNGKVLRLSADQPLAELDILARALQMPLAGNVLASPVMDVGDNRPWALLLIRRDPPWQLADEVKLEQSTRDLGGRLTELLGLDEVGAAAPAAEEPWGQESSTANELARLEAENEKYRQDVANLLEHIDRLQSQSPADGQTAIQSTGLVQALQMENERLKSALSSLEASRTVVAPISIEAQQAKEELRLAMEEVANLQERLDQAQKALLEGGTSTAPGKKIAENQVEVIASIAQELRQPLSSILGYTDLLLGESVGILGALQRKFLERVRSSTGRMNSLIGDLIRIAELDQAGYSAQRKAVDLGAVIDDAIGQLRPQLQEKHIALRVDLPGKMPELNTDRDALQQILYHLLQNADAATPAEGAITLRALIDSQPEFGDFVLLQVSDSGGGIPDEDLPRVFSRVYRATNPVIQGVGDTGVGLTIAETLTQALGGRIWVESESGVGATFSILLPLQPPEKTE